MQADILIKNGQVIDASQGVNQVADVAVAGGKIVGIIKNGEPIEAKETIDASGCLVTAGWIDCHMHLFEGCGMGGFKPDAFLFPMGITAAFDAGSAGPANFRLFSREIVDYAWANIKAFLNVSPVGLSPASFYPENLDPRYFPRKLIAETVQEYAEEIIALKVRISRPYVGELGLSPLRAAVEIGDEVNLPVVVHTTDPGGTVEEILDILRPGDVYCHAFHGTGNLITDDHGRILECVKRAREKGVIFDISNGMAHFSFKVGKPAIAQGFYPDTLSTDINNAHLYHAPAFSLPYVMSKFLAMGMPLDEVIDSVTYRSAKVFHLENEMGTLRPGVPADITICKLKNHTTHYFDKARETLDGVQTFVPQMTLRKGKIVFQQMDF